MTPNIPHITTPNMLVEMASVPGGEPFVHYSAGLKRWCCTLKISTTSRDAAVRSDMNVDFTNWHPELAGAVSLTYEAWSSAYKHGLVSLSPSLTLALASDETPVD